jgi:predicted ATPase
MPPIDSTTRLLRFDVFELDVRAGELRKNGAKLRLQGQPLQVLVVLLRGAGDLVTREDLHTQIWPADTFVDFDHGLHNAIARLREVLGDSADAPRFIETLPRRGYRFIAPVTSVNRAEPQADFHAERKDSRPNNLPPAGTPLVGRATEVAALKKLLGKRDVRLVTVTGPGGVGKSRLAVEVARELNEGFPDGLSFVPLAAVSEPDQITLAISQTLGIRESAGVTSADALKDYLRRSSEPLLLLLDNFEHLIAGGPGLAKWLATTPNLKLLVTSRAALHISNEHEFPLPPLALPDAKSHQSVARLAQCPSVALFTERAGAVKPGFALTEENASAVVEVCLRLDGLPLAIELAAARVKLLTPGAIRTRLASRLQLLTGGAKDLPERQQTLRQTIDWSYDLLSETEKRLFRRLSVFVGGCTLEAVESVCDAKQDLGTDVLDGMGSMVDKNLMRQIEQDDDEPRFTMLETIREYGLMKLREFGEDELTQRAHAAYCLVLAEESTADGDRATATGWLDRLETEHDNLNAALSWLEETKNAPWGLRMAIALFRFWEMREHLSEGRNWLRRMLKLEGADKLRDARARAFFSAGALASEQSDYDAATKLMGESLKIARELGDKQSMAVALNACAVNTFHSGDVADSRAFFEESLALWRELGDEAAQARGLSNLANVFKLQRDYAKANVLYQECQAIFRRLEDQAGFARAMNHQGDVAREQGDPVEARKLYEQSLAAFRELRDPWGIAGALEDLGTLSREQGEFKTAGEALKESLEIFLGLEHKRGVARLLEAFAGLAAAEREPERALRLAGAAAALRQSVGAPLTAAEQARLDWSMGPAVKALFGEVARTSWAEGRVLSMKAAVGEALAHRVGQLPVVVQNSSNRS